MIRFALNDRFVTTETKATVVLLDFLRSIQCLTGTKEGCREGDCGACSVLVGEKRNGNVSYRTVNSCLLPLAAIDGKHVVTIEGLNGSMLSPFQRAMVHEGGTQCGFCTPGFIVSFTGYLLEAKSFSNSEAIAALDGNICRCTGYEGIKRAVHRVFADLVRSDDASDKRVDQLIGAGMLPNYFTTIRERLPEIATSALIVADGTIVAGGTDLFVQRWRALRHADLIAPAADVSHLIESNHNAVIIGGGVTIEEIKSSPNVRELFPAVARELRLFGSRQIRNRATVAGNIVNASPIGDLTSMLLALDATLIIHGKETRELPLDKFFLAYKKIDLKPGEHIHSVRLPKPTSASRFHFEKVSKRTFLDIASVNTSIALTLDGENIVSARISAGGVAPIPLLLRRASTSLNGRAVTNHGVREAAGIAATEISPIDDARGSARYKSLLLRQLIVAHFLHLFPDRIDEGVLA